MDPLQLVLLGYLLGLSSGLLVGAAMYLALRERLEAEWLTDMRRSWLAGRGGVDPSE